MSHFRSEPVLILTGSLLTAAMRINHDQASGVLTIAGTLEIPEADQLRNALLEGLNHGNVLRLDLGESAKWDAAALQLLFSARASAGKSGKTLELTAVSESLVEACASLGLSLDDLRAPKDQNGF